MSQLHTLTTFTNCVSFVPMQKTLQSLSFLVALLIVPQLWAETFENNDVKITFVPRTPEQMASFYEARGFPKKMIDVIMQQCFITVGIDNKSKDVLWLDLENWRFSANGKPVKRQHRDYWKKRWMEMSIPLASQSTFRWTLLPEILDYLPDEHEGGNIVLPRVKEPITLNASFASGANKNGPVINISYDKLQCIEDEK